jgi:hypothetical protein
MKDADGLDVAASWGLDGLTHGDLNVRAANQRSRLRLHTQQNKNDRCGLVRLSKIAHMRKLRLRGLDRDENQCSGVSARGIRFRDASERSATLDRTECIGVLE